MKKLTEEQIYFLNNFCIGTWENTDEGIIVNGFVNIHNSKLNKIPVKFYRVKDYFSVSFNDLINLEGCPEYVGGDFICFYSNLKSLEGCPAYVGGNFWCNNNELTSLEGIGKIRKKVFCYNNKINYKKEKELRPKIYKKIEFVTLEKMLLTSM